MGGRSVESLPTTQKLFGYQTLGDSTRSRGPITVISCCLRPSSQWCAHSRERRRVEGHSTASLLHFRSKAELYGDRKIAYVVFISSRKLKHYFQAHEITVPTSHPLGDILNNKEASERIGKWATELSQFELNYVSRTSIKSQTLTDFMADQTPSVHQPSQPQEQTWTLYLDGAQGHLGAGASIVLIAPSGLHTKYTTRLEFKATNNIAEYEGHILGLNKAKALRAKTLLAKIDSQSQKDRLRRNTQHRSQN